MTFHINNQGEPGLCRAQISCPFGDFETQHYLSKDEARAAYEGAMSGKSINRVLSKALDAKNDLKKFLEKKKKKAGKIKFDPLPEVGKGFYLSAETFSGIKPGDDVLGGELKSVGRVSRGKQTFEVMYQDETVKRFRVPVGDDGLEPEKVWMNSADPEAATARKMAVSERNAAVAAEVVLPDVRRKTWKYFPPLSYTYKDETGAEAYLYWNPRDMGATYARRYLNDVKKAKKSGLANPHAFALKRLEAGIPEKGTNIWGGQKYEDQGQRRAALLVAAIGTQNDAYQPDHLDKIMIREMFPKGERPYIDYSFKDLDLKTF